MPKKMVKKDNTITDLVTSDLIAEAVSAVCARGKYNKRDKFLLGWILGLPAAVAGRMAGYSNTYSLKLSQETRKNPKLAERLQEITGAMPEKYRALCRMRLTDVAEIEGAALQELKENPRLAIEKPTILRQVKAGAGVSMADDFGEKPLVVQIALNVQHHLTDVFAGDHRVIDVEARALPEPLKRDDDDED